MKIGVLSLQGDFFAHCKALEKCGAEPVQVRLPQDLDGVHGLILPGGESTVISNLMQKHGLDKKIKSLSKKGFPLFGTCAGAIVISKKIVGETRFKPLGLIDITIKRNSYGRQVDSFEGQIEVLAQGHAKARHIKGIFIRAPEIVKTGKEVEVLARLGKTPVLVREKNVFASTFHPELLGETFVHELLVKEAEEFSENK